MSTESPDCARHDALLLEYAYGELAEASRQELEKHLPSCSTCQAELAALRSTRQTMSALVPEPAPEAGLASLLVYAQQQAERQARPARPKWMGWLLGVVPTAAAVVIVATVALHLHSRPLSGPESFQEEAPGAIPVAAAVDSEGKGAEMPRAKDQAFEKQAADSSNLFGAKAERRLAAKEMKSSPPAAEPRRASHAGGGGYDKADGHAASGFGAVATAQVDDMKAEVPAPRSKAKKTANLALDDSLVESEAAPAKPTVRAQESAGPSSVGGAAAAEAAGDVAAAEPAPSAEVRAAPPVAPPPAAAPQAPMRSEAPVGAGAAVSKRATEHAAAGDAMDALAQAAALGRAGQHRAAAEAYRSIYAADPSGPRAARALFSAAVEEQAAGQLAAAAADFERYAQAFPGGSHAPAALARAAEIRRSREGEGAATALEQDLLRRYPQSPEASGLRARLGRSDSEKATRKAAAPMQFEDRDLAPAAAQPPAPAQSR